MYRLTTPQGESYLTEKVNYIRVHTSGVYLLTDVNHAEAWRTGGHRTSLRTAPLSARWTPGRR